MAKLKLTNTPTSNTPKKKPPPTPKNRSHKKKVDASADRDLYEPAPRRTNGRSILANATSSFNASASGNEYGNSPHANPKAK
jgi:hypothetical protein